MDFILNEAIEEDEEFKLVFSDDSGDEEFSEEEKELNFIDDDEGEVQQEPSFYRVVNNSKRVRFSNQTRNPEEVVDESEDEYYGEDDMPELYDPEKREDVEFDLFNKHFDNSQIFKKSLLRFENVNNQFFYAVLYRLLHSKTNGQNVQLESAKQILGTKYFIELRKIEKSTMLDYSIFGFYDWCQVINEVLFEYRFFLRFYERRNKFRYQFRQKLKEKNQMK